MRLLLITFLILAGYKVNAGFTPAFVDASSVQPRRQSVVTDASATPTTVAFRLTASQNAFRVWTDSPAVTESSFDLYVVRNGGTAVKVRLFRHMGRIITGTSGDSIALGTSDGRTVKISRFYSSPAVETITGTTGTANADKAGPPLWSPTAAHISLPANARSFKINSDGTERDVFVSEWDGSAWTPARWVKLPSGTAVNVRVNYRKVALANYPGTALSVTAPLGSVIGGSMATMILPIPAVTGTTHSVSTVATLKTAMSNAVAGDEIVLDDGTYALDINPTETTFAANNGVGGRFGMEGILFRSQSGDRTAVILSGTALNGAWNVDNGGAASYATFKDLTFDFTAITASMRLRGGKWFCQNVRWTGVSATSDLISFEVTAADEILFDALRCHADNAGADCWNGSGHASFNAGSLCRLIDCSGSTAGATSSDQVVTSHIGLPVEVWGGNYTNSALSVFATDGSANCIIRAFFTSTYPGARLGQIGQSSAFGATLATGTSSSSLAPVTYLLLSKVNSTMPTDTLNLLRNITAPVVAHNRIYGIQGRAVFNSVAGGTFLGNIIGGFAEGIRIDNSSGATGSTAILGNTIASCTTALSLSDATLSFALTNNACATNSFSVTCTATSNGNMTKASNVLDPTVDADYTAGADDTTGVNAETDSNNFPTAAGNCDGNGYTGLTDYVGASDPLGLVLIYKPTRVSRGAREIPAIYSAAELYPDLW